MINFSFTSNLNLFSKHRGTKKGWGSTYIEFSSRLGWNFFTRTRHWDKEMKKLLPPITKLKIRMVEYYGETQEKVWNFLEKKYDYYWKFEDKPKNSKEINPSTIRLIQVIYRLPLLTITNSYHTSLDQIRHEEFLKDVKKNIDKI